MKIDNKTKQELLDALRPNRQQENDLTIPDAMEEWGIGLAATKSILDAEVKKGNFQRLKGVLNSGCRGFIYRPIKDE